MGPAYQMDNAFALPSPRFEMLYLKGCTKRSQDPSPERFGVSRQGSDVSSDAFHPEATTSGASQICPPFFTGTGGHGISD